MWWMGGGKVLKVGDRLLYQLLALTGLVTVLSGFMNNVGALALLLARLILALYLLSSALAGFDRKRLSAGEIALRLLLAVALMLKVDLLWIGAAGAAAVLLFVHAMRPAAQARAPGQG